MKMEFVMSFNRVYLAVSLLLVSSVNFSVNADTLSDVKSKLETLNGDSAINVEFTSKYTETSGKDDEAKSGLITLPLSYNHKGLQITYNKDILDKVAKEESQKEQDEGANTPTLSAMSRVESSDLLEQLSSASSLLRFLNKAKFASEKTIEHRGSSATELIFDLPIESIITGEDAREYIDEFAGQYRLVVDNQGVPIESELTFAGSGSAYVFFSLEMEQTSTSQYQVVGNRLVNTSQTYTRKQSSTFGDSESVGEETLAIMTSDLVGNSQDNIEVGSCKKS
ncbi:hypothetical protein BTO11_08035 [Psychrosphaera saromensis]|uniref:Uncharacterized protein n=2 Tax=Psychrosphaera saromensis TaxID=716813 RepID=A0A2S7UV43_9GAMM|nr:hypothetical protein BTO11_08035 [Psychrosphaera saromensis]